ncbi:hypothetical protein GGX14DRAFT_649179 [Mycena pura]|uniref:Uncharacterized protein n=1 Tax=Mycena pura TaxID=153505 RepID=A0AAD6YMZ4_9AGAR|nr:hypothetical protein GGX14DRAFT_649179 [Mycena pura]
MSLFDAAPPMFRAHSPGYSSFFISGLLSPPASSPASLHSRDSNVPRRGSLPTVPDSAAPSSMSISISSAADDASMFYFTLQPRRDKDEYRSFLSLDLAESQSLRSHSVRHRPSGRRHQSREPPFSVDFQIPDSPCLLPPRSPVGLKRNSSNPRSIPSPKPAPVSSLPNVPSSSLVRSPTPVAPIQQALPQRKPSVASQATRASATTSTVSTRYRRTRRNKALACLEGRRPPRLAPTDNFMSLSEDEEGDEEPASYAPTPEDEFFDASLSDDQLIMLIARLDDGDLQSSPVSPPPPPRARESSTRAPPIKLAPTSRRRKTAPGMKSFMDFYNDDDSARWSWRSFIEVAT